MFLSSRCVFTRLGKSSCGDAWMGGKIFGCRISLDEMFHSYMRVSQNGVISKDQIGRKSFAQRERDRQTETDKMSLNLNFHDR